MTSDVLASVFDAAALHTASHLEGMVLKPNMVISGKKAANRATPQQVAEATVRCLKRYVPSAVPGIAFLSGGQCRAEATRHLSLMNKLGPLPWELTFSYGRALQDEALKAWGGKPRTSPRVRRRSSEAREAERPRARPASTRPTWSSKAA